MVESPIREISFSELEVSPREVSLKVEYEESHQLWFAFDRALPVSTTQIALALSTLCGEKFGRIVFDFEIEEDALATIRRFTKAEVEAHPTEDSVLPLLATGNVLSFSGGFDSLSAWRLMPKDSHLVSLDFGGWFEREAEFFRDFDTLVVSTNMRSTPTRRTPLTRNHWSFMAVGAILSARYFNARYHTFGSILGESLARGPSSVPTLPVLSAVGYEEAGYARGLTEVGTALVILQSDPQRVVDSLKSLAGPNDRKNFRKTALSLLLTRKLGVQSEFPSLDFARSPRIRFGDDYASSLAALYCMAQGQGELIEGLFDSVPDEAHRVASEYSLSFMEKVNWDAYRGFPAPLRAGLWGEFERYGLEPYGEDDWVEVGAVRSFLEVAYREAHAPEL